MVNRRLMTFLEENNLLNEHQHAFRAGRGTSSYFADLAEILAEIEQSNAHAEFALLDINKAYDQVWRTHIMRQIDSLNTGKRIRSCISNFLLDRRFRVSYGGSLSKDRIQENGVPQGSVLAVTLFLIAINPVFDVIPKNIRVLVYADDIVLVAISKHLPKVRNRLIEAVDAVNTWAKSVKFRLSAP